MEEGIISGPDDVEMVGGDEAYEEGGGAGGGVGRREGGVSVYRVVWIERTF